MASISAGGSKGHHTYTLNVWEDSYDVNSNTSTVKFNMYLSGNSSYKFSSYNVFRFWIYIDGNEYYYYHPFSSWSGGNEQVLGDQAITIQHSPDGSKTVSFNFEVTDNSSASFTTGNASSGTDYLTLTTIPRASTPSLSSQPTSGSQITINTNRASSSFTHTLTYSFGSKSGTIATNVGDSTPWTPPHSLCTEIPSTTSGTGTITCTTYSGGTNIGSKSINFTLTAASSLKPTISTASASEGNSTISALNWGLYIQSMSYPTIACTANGIQSSSITKYTLKCYSGNTVVKSFEDTTVSGLNSKIAAGFDKTNQYTYKLQVQDTRNRSSEEYPITFNLTPYSPPTIYNGYKADRCDSSGVEKDDGSYVRCEFKGDISSLSNNNPMTVKIGIKKVTDTNYTYTTYINSSTSDSSFDYTSSAYKLLSNVDPSYQYEIIYSVSDQFNTIERTLRISTEFILIDFRNTGRGIAFGKRSEKDSLEFGMSTEITGILNVIGEYYKDGEPFEPGGSSTPLDGMPVGYIYISANSTSPANLFGGTWEKLSGYYLYFGNNYQTTSYTGTGTQGHTLTAAQSGLPQHSHGMNGAGGHDHSISGIATRKSGSWNGVVASAGTSDRGWSTVSWVGDHTHGIHNAGPNNASEAHSHNIATLQAYAWRRTA